MVLCPLPVLVALWAHHDPVVQALPPDRPLHPRFAGPGSLGAGEGKHTGGQAPILACTPGLGSRPRAPAHKGS